VIIAKTAEDSVEDILTMHLPHEYSLVEAVVQVIPTTTPEQVVLTEAESYSLLQKEILEEQEV
jgi:hypothetical protein